MYPAILAAALFVVASFLHIVVKAKGNTFDVYVAPADFAQKYGIT